MGTLEFTGPNAQQIQYWNELAGPRWLALHELIDQQIAPLGRRTMDRAALVAGERVLDVGCGCGQTTLELAQRVGATGAVTGIDISSPMLERGRRVAEAAGLRHVHFENADAQTHTFALASFNLLFSRFGVMFFADPTAAFANLCTALRPGGRLAFVCWRALPENPWMMVPLGAALQHIPPPPMPPPGAPGPFAFADSDRVRDILSAAGFTDIAIDRLDEILTLPGAGDLNRTAEYLVQMGPAAAALREASAETTAVVTAAVRESLRPFATADGVRMPGAAWMVTARRP